MKRFAKRSGLLGMFMAMILGAISHQAYAHDLWLQVRDYTPEMGGDISLTLGYGHHFPAREFMEKNDLAEIYILDGKKRKIGVKTDSEVAFKTDKNLKEQGTYLVVAQKKGGFFTKTTEGTKRGQSKEGLSNVVQCTYSVKYAKAVVNVGGSGGKAASEVLGHELEIIPTVDPGTLTQGNYLPVKVLFKGKPLPSTHVFATYMGFSTKKNTFAYATKTDKQGMANIKMLTSGVWLIAAYHMEAYPDANECDQYKFSSSLTFEIR
jgi:uncharacterized GH25 family protein